MGLIIVLVLLGLFFLVAELVFLPGVTLGTALSVVSYGIAVYLGFDRLGFVGGVITLVVVLAISLVATVVSLRAKTWQRLALKDEIKGSSMETPSQELRWAIRLLPFRAYHLWVRFRSARRFMRLSLWILMLIHVWKSRLWASRILLL